MAPAKVSDRLAAIVVLMTSNGWPRVVTLFQLIVRQHCTAIDTRKVGIYRRGSVLEQVQASAN